ncbi:MAG TPA: hypothetical protein PK445_03515 [Methanolinea sp.]|jgi:deoxyribodipyrimidine photolyase|nr:hypothetical protein [Methanolinea sp.]MDI6898401.1 hypothetical protein [Methanolinea sp.]HOS81773.1 hypothetical protein [Methanolinea sp.]HPC55175.1 hypothetical protein [Methanolinea sp.]HQE85210.1 hypothetical protein [Methanolinea sp.]
MTDMWVIFEGILPYLLVFIGLIIVYFIIREFRLMYSRTRLAQLELEREKINLLKADLEQRGRPFYRVSPQDLEELKRLDEENVELETDIFARHTAVEKRLKRLESRVALTKLDRMIEKIKREEERLG